MEFFNSSSSSFKISAYSTSNPIFFANSTNKNKFELYIWPDFNLAPGRTSSFPVVNIDIFGFMPQDILALDDLDDDTNYGIARYVDDVDTYEISPDNFVAPLVKAVQELSAKVDSLTARIEVLEG